jgi:hypothetical protein
VNQRDPETCMVLTLVKQRRNLRRLGPGFLQLVGCPVDDLLVGVNKNEKKNIEAMIYIYIIILI